MNRIIKIARLMSPTANEPLTVEQLKLYLQVEGSAYDLQFHAYIVAARGMVEKATNTSLVDSNVELRLNIRSVDFMTLPFGPVAWLTDVRWKKCPAQILPMLDGYDYIVGGVDEVAFTRYGDWYINYSTTAIGDPELTEAVKIQAGHLYMTRDLTDAPKWHPRAKLICDQYATS